MFEDLSVVELTRSVAFLDGVMPKGTVGAIVHVWKDGEHFEVEFTDPPCVVSVETADIMPTGVTPTQLP